jgi:hypothetical protein
MDTWLEHAISEYEKTNHQDGDILSHEWLKFALQITAPKTIGDAYETQWTLLSRMDAFREHLLTERRVALQNVRGDGYRIVPPSEQARYAAELAMRHIHKGLTQGARLMEHTRIDALTDSQRQRHIDAETKLAGVGHMMLRQRRDVFALFGPKPEV